MELIYLRVYCSSYKKQSSLYYLKSSVCRQFLVQEIFIIQLPNSVFTASSCELIQYRLARGNLDSKHRLSGENEKHKFSNIMTN
jgi:hypothetical protein